jgi:hypothetical protein
LRLVFFERGQHFGFDKYFHCLYQDFPWNVCGLCKFYTLKPLACIINAQTVLLRNIRYGFFAFYKNALQILKQIFPSEIKEAQTNYPIWIVYNTLE